jgi:hypothetical protein
MEITAQLVARHLQVLYSKMLSSLREEKWLKTKRYKILIVITAVVLLAIFVKVVIPFYKNTRLCNAILQNDNLKVKSLFNNYSINVNSWWNRYCEYPIVIAGVVGNIEIIETLLNHGAHIDINKGGDSALHKSSYLGHSVAVEFLIKNGATNKVLDNQCLGLSPFMTSVERRRLETVKVFLKYQEALKIDQTELLDAMEWTNDENDEIRKLIFPYVLEKRIRKRAMTGK